MATREEMLIEADRRGLLTGEKKAAFDEAVRRGIIQTTTAQAPKGGPLDAVYEPIKAIAGGAAREVTAGLAGIANLPRGVEASVGAIERTRANFPDVSPQTQRGQDSLEGLTGVVDKATRLARTPVAGAAGVGKLLTSGDPMAAADTVREIKERGIGPYAGDRTFQVTGSPLAATAVTIAPDVAGAVAGFAGKRALQAGTRTPKSQLIANGDLAPGFRKELQSHGILSGELTAEDIAKLPDFPPRQAAQALIANKLGEGAGDEYLAPFRLTGKGKVGPDDLAISAEKQGFPKGDIMAVKTADPATRKEMLKMLRIHRSIKANAANAEKVRHTDIIGDSVMKRFNFIRNQTKADRLELDRIASRELRGQQVDVARVENAFLSGLEDLNIRAVPGTSPPQLIFAGSDVVKNPAARKFIKDVADLLAEPLAPDAFRAHRLKRQLDELIDFNKKGKGGLSEAGRTFAKNIRHELNQVIRDVNPGYAQVNDRLSSGIGALNDFGDSMGRSIDIFADNAPSIVGTNMRKLMSNYSTRQNIENAAGQLDSVAAQFGGEFKDNVKRLVTFGKVLDDRLGAVSARGSFKGEIDSSVANNLNRAARGDFTNIAIDKTVGKGMEMLNRSRGINDDNAYRAMEALIRRDLN